MPDLTGMKILVIGSGPTAIGQTGECNEGALEACRVLADQGCRLISVDATPDTVFNGAPWTHIPKIGPLTPQSIADIIEAEKPDILLTLFAGRKGMRLVSDLHQLNALKADGIQVWGPSETCLASIKDRDTLQKALAPIDLKTPAVFPVDGVDAAVEKAQEMGFPVVLRCDDAQLLTDGLLIYNQDELNRIGATLSGESTIKFSVEPSLMEWQQIELEVLRDCSGASIILDAVEYMDTAGIHPGDAIGVCPPQILPESLKKSLHAQAEAIAEHLDIVGSATLRFAYHPTSHDLLVLAVHPRYTAVSVIASRIHGISTARLATLLAAGGTLEQIGDAPFGLPATVEDPKAIGVKWPKWDFLRLKHAEDRLGPQMQSTGYSMGYGDSFKEALQKAARSVWSEHAGLIRCADAVAEDSRDTLLTRLGSPSSRRPLEIFAALCKGATVDEISERTHISPWYLEQFKGIADIRQHISQQPDILDDAAFLGRIKAEGFSNADLGHISNTPVHQIEQKLSAAGVKKHWNAMSDHAPSFLYGTYAAQASQNRQEPGAKKVVIIGSGAFGIGNGKECDYGIFHATNAIKEMGYTPIVVNSNITSSAYAIDSPWRFYCEPLSIEDILDVIRFEKPDGVMTQYAGASADKLTLKLSSAGCKLLGTTKEILQRQQDRTKLKKRLRQLGIPQPLLRNADTVTAAVAAAEEIGYPVLVSDSDFTTTELVRDSQALDQWLSENDLTDGAAIWIEQLLEYAIEAQAEVLCDGSRTHVAAVMEHIELAGVHAVDSSTVMPPYSIAPRHVETITAHCHKIATAIGIKGLTNIRFGIYRDTVYLLETAGNVSRNLAMVSKALDLPLVSLATRLILGESIENLGISDGSPKRCCIRVPVFPFNAFSKVDPLLGPNMRATGQVIALEDTFGMAYFRAMEATATPLPTKGTVLITVTNEDKSSILEPARIFLESGFNIMATKGTHKILAEHGIPSTLVRKLGFGRPNLVDEIKNGNVQIVINTPTGGQGELDDSVIRKAAIANRIVNITTPASAQAAAKGIAAAIELDS